MFALELIDLRCSDLSNCVGIRDGQDDDDASVYLFEDDNGSVIPIQNVSISRLVEESVCTQRIVEDRISNPHGEHAENMWIISKDLFNQLLQNPEFKILSGSSH